VVSEILNNVGDVEFCRLTASDVVRHRLVGEIVSAYDQYDQVQQSKAAGARSTS
jgi:phosphate starvation-inducible PhoH-like protein